LSLAQPATQQADEDELETLESATSAGAAEKVKLCVRCGTLREGDSGEFCPCGQSADIRDAYRLRTKDGDLKECPSCGAHAQQRELLQRLYTGTDEPVAEIATTLYQSANRDHVKTGADRQKLLTFSDSRQDAAFFAPYLESLYKASLRRHVVLEVIEAANAPLAVPDLATRLATVLEQRGWLGTSATIDE